FMQLMYRLILEPRIFLLQAEDGIRDATVTGVQTCALPISRTKEDRPIIRRPGQRSASPATSLKTTMTASKEHPTRSTPPRRRNEIGRASCRERVERRAGVGAVEQENARDAGL